MKTSLLFFCILIVLSAGCGGVANEADDAARLFGDDIARFTAEYGDDIARTSEQYADDLGRQYRYSEEAATYWKTIIQSAQDAQAYRLLYREQNLSPLQSDFVTWLRAETSLSENESLLYLQSVCSVANYVQFYNEYPSKSATQFYVEQVAERNGILIFSVADFTESVLGYTDWLIKHDSSHTGKEAAGLIFEGLCLVSDIADN